jgi:NADPH-dependent 2,4-dienoyl-CoA reductase/sulfur reductase-like enzyme
MPYNIEDPSREMEDLVVLSAGDAREKRGIDLHLRTEVTAIDPDAGRVTVRNLEDGTERSEGYDALVIATGARAIRLPLPGMDLPGVFVLRELADGAAIKRMLSTGPRKAVVVGAGYIGMEMAHVLTARGLSVTVIEKLPQILPGWSAETVAVVQEELERHGVAVHTGVTLEAAEAGPGGHVVAVVHQNFGNDPSLGVLHDLAVALQLHPPRGYDRPGDPGGDRPIGEAAEQADKGQHTQHHKARRAPFSG